MEETCVKLLEPFCESLIDDDAVLVRIISLAEKGSVGCNRCEVDRYAEDTKASVIGTKRANDFKPKGDHNAFTHFPKYRNCEACRMTKTTRATGKHRPLKRTDGIPPSTTLGELTAADHKILDLDGKSRNNHRNALIVQDGYSYGLQSYPTKTKDPRETASCLRRSTQTIQWSSSERVRTYNGRMRRRLLIVQKPAGSRKELFDE